MSGGETEMAHRIIRDCAANGTHARFTDPDQEEAGELAAREGSSGAAVSGEWLANFLSDPSSRIHRRGVTIIGVRITSGLPLDGATLQGPVRLIACDLGDELIQLTGAHTRTMSFTGSSCGGLAGLGIDIDGDLLLDNGFTATGEVNLEGANLHGKLSCSGGTFHNAGGYALTLGHANVEGDVLFNDGFSSHGEVHMPGSTIGGSLKCRKAWFANPGGAALRAEQVHVTRTVFLDTEFEAHGAVRLLLATIGGDLDCTGGRFLNKGGHALLVPSARIAESVWLNGGFHAEGSVVLAGDSIGGDLDCSSGEFFNQDGAAVWADGAQVSGSVHLSNGFRASGEVRLHGASIGRKLDCAGGIFENPNGEALGATATQVAGDLILSDGFSAKGLVSLRRATAGSLVDDRASWPARVDLSGFRYGQLHGSDRDWKARKEWLRRQPEPASDAYIHLASIYRSNGHEHDARKILIERHNALLRPPAHWGYTTSRLNRAWRWVLRLTIGHGYEPWRVLFIIAVPLVGMSLWYSLATRSDLLVPANETRARASECDPSYTCVQPIVYTLDTLVPLVDFGQRSKWVPDQSHEGSWLRDGRWLAAATWLTTGMGWVIATLVAASFSQVVRRE